MGDLTNNFSRKEFACRCGCGSATIDYELLAYLQVIREILEKKITIISGHRCQKHNQRVGGAVNSFHLRGMAADIKIDGMTPSQVYDFLEENLPNHQYGIGLYNTFVHIDVRSKRSRWIGI